MRHTLNLVFSDSHLDKMGTGLLATNGNSATLIKVDRLRELIGTRIFLPQVSLHHPRKPQYAQTLDTPSDLLLLYF